MKIFLFKKRKRKSFHYCLKSEVDDDNNHSFSNDQMERKGFSLNVSFLFKRSFEEEWQKEMVMKSN